jgi:anti-sigma factor RsiW
MATNIDETDLLAYADGHLSPERRAEVAAAIASSADLAACLAAMRASVLPYRAAYGAQRLPPLPVRLSARVAELVEHDFGRPKRRSSSRVRLVAAFAVGVACGAVALTMLSTRLPLSSGVRVSPWVQAVADYQQLYSRETLASVTEDHQLTERVINDLRLIDGMIVPVPDLRSAGLTFKRVQRLSFHHQPVVQMVYLPERGDPIAVCVTWDARADEAPHAQQIGELSTVAWRRGKLAYVLLGKAPSETMLDLAERLASGRTESLYGRGGSDRTITSA